MEWDIYDLESKGGFEYVFYSEGSKGRIKKIIEFQHLSDLGKNVFNVAFGDFNRAIGGIDHLIISNNGDQLKVMHTVAEAIINFISSRPDAIILIQGSTSSRTRLYQMKIAGFWAVVSKQFEILGEFENEWLPFQKGVNYKRFLVYKK